MSNLPKYIKPLLSKEEVNELWLTIQDYMLTIPKDPVFDETGNDLNIPEGSKVGKILNTSMGKIYFNLPNGIIPKHIQEKIDAAAISLEPGVKFHSATYTEYSLEYGKPSLNFHQDRFDFFLLIDLQVNSSTSWPLSAAGIEYVLEDGDALALHAGSTDHGRPAKTFVDGETVSMIFLDYMRPGSPIA